MRYRSPGESESMSKIIGQIVSWIMKAATGIFAGGGDCFTGPWVDGSWFSVKHWEVLRKITASFFLTVMALVIGLHSPVLGYCAAEGEVFLGEHVVETTCDHGCQHAPDLVEVPCEEEHEFVTVDPGDFQWSPLMMTAPPIALVPDDIELVLRPVFSENAPFVSVITSVNPPPPDVPIFRRDAALRL